MGSYWMKLLQCERRRVLGSASGQEYPEESDSFRGFAAVFPAWVSVVGLRQPCYAHRTHAGHTQDTLSQDAL